MKDKQYSYCVENPKQEGNCSFYYYFNFTIEQVAARVIEHVAFGDQNEIKIIIEDVETGKRYEVWGRKLILVDYCMVSCIEIEKEVDTTI